MWHRIAVISLVISLVTQVAGAAAPGDVIQDCDVCPELVVIPAGTFVMGDDTRAGKEGPAREVTIAKPFALGRYEVTFDEYEACVDAGPCGELPYDHKWGQGRRPVINVDFAQVEAYLAWLSDISGHSYRLPSEAEWEYANRAGTATAYWWGDEVGENHANCRKCGSEWSGHKTAVVGSFPSNPFGLFDTTGNVLEWVSDCWNPNHDGASSDPSPRRDGDCQFGVVRGGNWYYVANTARSSWRAKNDRRTETYGIGFRVLRPLAAP